MVPRLAHGAKCCLTKQLITWQIHATQSIMGPVHSSSLRDAHGVTETDESNSTTFVEILL